MLKIIYIMKAIQTVIPLVFQIFKALDSHPDKKPEIKTCVEPLSNGRQDVYVAINPEVKE